MVLPRDGDHMAEWQGNLMSRFHTRDGECGRRVVRHNEHTFDGGIATTGTMVACDGRIAHSVSFAALPDGHTTVYCSSAHTLDRIEMLLHEGMCLNIANDLFNDNIRRVYCEGAMHEVIGFGAEREDRQLDSPWLNVDEMLGVVELDGRERFTLSIDGERRADGRSLCYDQILHPHYELRRTLHPGAMIEDAAVALITGLDAEQTRRWAAWHLGPAKVVENTRALTVRGVNDRWYLLATCFNDEPVEMHLPLTMQAAGSRILAGDPEGFRLVGDGAILSLPPGELLLVALAANARG